jgi:PIN domain nuclease of toxin-antitoxin system
MKVVLDTHVWLWYLLGDPHLSQTHRHLIEDESIDLSLSSISIWEAHLLIEKERLPVSDPPDVWIRNALRTLQVREAGVTFAIAVRSRTVALTHQDPGDRFIAATAIELKAPLLTADERLRACPDLRCL